MARPSAVPERYHHQATVVVDGEPTPLLFDENGDAFVPLISFLRSAKYRDYSLAWKREMTRAAGVLLDYVKARPEPSLLANRGSYLSDMIRALRDGTITNGVDPLGLAWQPLPSSQINKIRQRLTVFTDWLADTYSNESMRLNPMVQATAVERIRALRALDKKNEGSLFHHLGRRRRQKARVEGRAVSRLRTPTRAEDAPYAFPRAEMGRLFWEGFRRDGVGDGAPLMERYRLRDMMIAWLQAWGGLRASEAFHIWTDDVGIGSNAAREARVLVYDPADGLFIVGRQRVTRRQWLKERYGLRPRNELAGRLRAGWKDPLLSPSKDNYMRVFWFGLETAAEEFLTMYRAYLAHRSNLPLASEHPWLFVTAGGGPYCMADYFDAFRASVRRLGLDPSKEAGTTSHGLRHAYAQTLKDALKGEEYRKAIQEALHHRHPYSQDVYTRPSQAKIQTTLDAGMARLQESQVQAVLSQGSAPFRLPRLT